jgi:uncharacterized membrane protein YdbT with pleckstrin-like domain
MLDVQLKGLVAAVIVGVIVGLATALSHHSHHVLGFWVAAAVLIVIVITFLVGLKRRLSTTYTITSQRLSIRLGLLSRELHETRLERVQNVGTRQSLLERALGIGTVDFDTAGSAGFDFAFHGVTDPQQIVRTVNDALRAESQPGV